MIDRLPKTPSGKTLRQMIDGEAVVIPSTIDDIEVSKEFTPKLTSLVI
ncbi:MAG: hypothetical protein MJK12_03705 [Colwellia sp.]|nr:hypothetical protein [Colwellia sp.]